MARFKGRRSALDRWIACALALALSSSGIQPYQALAQTVSASASGAASSVAVPVALVGGGSSVASLAPSAGAALAPVTGVLAPAASVIGLAQVAGQANASALPVAQVSPAGAQASAQAQATVRAAVSDARSGSLSTSRAVWAAVAGAAKTPAPASASREGKLTTGGVLARAAKRLAASETPASETSVETLARPFDGSAARGGGVDADAVAGAEVAGRASGLSRGAGTSAEIAPAIPRPSVTQAPARGSSWLKPAQAAARRARSWLAPTLTAAALSALRLALPAETARAADARQDGSWWKNRDARHTAVSVPIYALRRGKDDPGVGKYTDLARYYREVLSKEGADVVVLLPHFATLDESPYSPVSLYAANEDNLDWAEVPEVAGDEALKALLRASTVGRVDYSDLRKRERAVAAEAYAIFRREQLDRNTARAAEYRDFVRRNAWLTDYAEFMTLSSILGKPALDWTPSEVERARQTRGFAEGVQTRRYAQWNAGRQLKEAVQAVHAAGGRALFDIPMFRGKNSVDAWKHPEYFTDLRTRNPGIINQWIHEDWKELALWNWTKLKSEGYRSALDCYRHWLDFGFDGTRVDALHFAYKFGNGQMASGDEPGDDYVRALAGVLAERSAFPLAEAFEGKDEAARRFGFVTVKGDWRVFSSHDDPRQTDFMPRLLDMRQQAPSGPNAAFTAYTLGDEWADPFPVKEMRDGKSIWHYRIPMPTDPDYKNRIRRDSGPQLRALRAIREDDVWREAGAVRQVLERAADTFVKHENGGVQIWAASMDWFLEEWGRDTFVSLPGLLVSTGRLEEAKQNIRGFAKHERNGLLPNRIAENAEYNTADAPMWFIQAVRKVVEASGDRAFAAEMLPVMRRIIAKYSEGTGYDRYGRFNKIYMDSDGLIVSPAQSTWMDADPGGLDKPVTPRNGKAVEINALWYANLRWLASMQRKAGAAREARGMDALADKVKSSFNDRFYFTNKDNAEAWGGMGGALRDVVDGDLYGDAIRPNMLFAVSHGGDLLTPERRKEVVLAATRDLLTPYGLRTLSYRDSNYKPVYETWKPPMEKDQAYHQGTAWPWLMGAYIDALAKVRGSQGWPKEEIAAEVRGLMKPLAEFLVSRPEASLPEVFDGGKRLEALTGFSLDDAEGLAKIFDGVRPVPNPGGTRSQAWSVGETIRALSEYGAPGAAAR